MVPVMLLLACLGAEDEAIARLRRELGPGLSHLDAIKKAGALGAKGRPLVATLLHLLHTSEYSRVRGDVARALGEIGPEGDALADKRSPLVAGLLRALDREKSMAPCARLIPALRRTARPTPAVVAALGRALRHGSVIVELLSDCAPSTKLAVLRAAFSGERPEKAAVALELVIALGPKARPLLPALVQLLQHEDRVVRCNAARAILAAKVLSLVPKADAVLAALVEGLDDNEMSHAPGINAPLDEQTAPLPRTARALVALLRSTDVLRRASAARALEEIPASVAISAPALEAALEDEAQLVRLRAAFSLVALGRPARAIPWLLAYAHENAVEAPYVLARAGPAAESAAPLLLRHLRDHNKHLRADLAEALWRVGIARSDGVRTHDPRQEALDTLGKLASNPDDQVAWKALSTIRRIGPPAARLWPQVARILKARDGLELRDEAIRTLASLGPRAGRAEPALVRLLDHHSSVLRLEAAVALNAIRPGHRHALATVLAVVRRHPYRASEACRALQQMGPHAHRAVPWLVRMLPSGVSKEAGQALWVIDPEAARRAGAW